MFYAMIQQLKPGMTLARDVKVYYPVDILLLKKGEEISEQKISRLRLFDVPGVYICDGVKDNEEPPELMIAEDVKASALNHMQSIFPSASNPKKPISEKKMQQLSNTVVHLVDNIYYQDDIMINITDLKSYDEYTYHHCLSVCVISIAIGIQLHLPKDTLIKLGLASILHDIGKLLIPVDILNKPTSLTPYEYEIMKLHSQMGAEYLLDHNIGDDIVRDAILCHHEKWDGTGYPLRLKEENIPFFSRIIAVADMYDALTSYRPYREPISSVEATEYIMGNGGTFFDFDVVNAFIKKVELYPMNTIVTLSNGKKYVVVDNQHNMRPVIRSIDNPNEIIDLFNDKAALHLVIL